MGGGADSVVPAGGLVALAAVLGVLAVVEAGGEGQAGAFDGSER